jgi:hypothetical protein
MGSDKTEMKEGGRKPTFSLSIGEEAEMNMRGRGCRTRLIFATY